MKTTRREFLKTIGMGTAALATPGLMTLSCSGSKPPNIIFIMSDDHAERAISCYGSDLIKTPGIDRIAREGIRFENSFVTNSICGPSRATLLTGKYSHLNGFRDNRDTFDGSQMTFPKLLQKAGYQTAIVGKWHLKTEPTGFDHWQILKGQGQYYNPSFNENGNQIQYTGYTTDLITDKAIDMLGQLGTEKPFCLLVHHKAPHRNWMPNLKHLDTFKEDLPQPKTLKDDYKGRKAAEAADMRIDDMFLSFDFKLHEETIGQETGSGGQKAFASRVIENWENTYGRFNDEQKALWDAHYDKINAEFKALKLEGDELLNWKYQHYIKDYLRCILSLDENIDRLLDHLDDQGLAENTIVIYTSDQGFYLGEHGWYDKRFMYEESLGMPLVMRYPREIQAGQVSKQMVMNLDFAPTFLDYAGVSAPPDMQGHSLRGLVRGQDAESWRESIYYHYYEHPHGWHNVRRHYGVRNQRYKLIHFYVEDDWELFDLQKDPNEMDNVFASPAYAEVVEEMKQELTRLQKQYGDTALDKE
jgi:arylsulfatase A-like enzyme